MNAPPPFLGIIYYVHTYLADMEYQLVGRKKEDGKMEKRYELVDIQIVEGFGKGGKRVEDGTCLRGGGGEYMGLGVG